MDQPWTALFDKLGEIQRTLGDHGSAVDALKKELSAHMHDEGKIVAGMAETLKHLDTEVESIKKGFPTDPTSKERNPYYHASWHENDANKSRESREFKVKLLGVVAGTIIIAVLSAIGAFLISGTKVELKRALNEPTTEIHK